MMNGCRNLKTAGSHYIDLNRNSLEKFSLFTVFSSRNLLPHIRNLAIPMLFWYVRCIGGVVFYFPELSN